MSEPETSRRTFPQRIAEFLARSVFLPSRLSYERVLSPISQGLVVFLFGFLVILVFPPVTQWVIQNEISPEVKGFTKENTEFLKRWLEFIQTCFEFLTIVALGGGVFTERAKTMSKETLDRIQNALDRSSTDQLEQAQEGLKRNVEDLLNAIGAATWTNLPYTILRIVRLSVIILRVLYLEAAPIGGQLFAHEHP
jgi:energy-coupling factor transporter transmembrane protein EcfT